MGYETRFRLHGELDEKFKAKLENVSHIELEKEKNVLVAMCMLPIEDKLENWRLEKLYTEINYAVRMYYIYLSNEWKNDLKNRLEDTEYTEKNEISFCGWEFSENRNTLSQWTEEEILDYYTSNLFELAIHSVQPPFTNKDEVNDMYYSKLEKVKEIVNDISDTVYDMWNYMFVQRYRNSEDADESDGYEKKYPEEKDEEE